MENTFQNLTAEAKFNLIQAKVSAFEPIAQIQDLLQVIISFLKTTKVQRNMPNNLEQERCLKLLLVKIQRNLIN
jgi:hypothetical protein